MRKMIKRFIASVVYEGIDEYMKKHRFGIRDYIEVVPMTHDEFGKHLLNNVSQGKENRVKDYLSGSEVHIRHKSRIIKLDGD